MNFNILEASDKDLDNLAKLFDAYRVFYEQESNVDESYHFLKARLDNAESHIFYACTEVIYLGFAQLYPVFSSVSVKRVWLLNDLYVVPGYRKQGVASALLNRARSFAEETNAKGVSLATAVNNYDAQSLYEKFGFKKDNDYMHYFLSTNDKK